MAKAKGTAMLLFVRGANVSRLNSLENNRKENCDVLKPLAKTIVVYLNCAYYTLQCPFRVNCNGKRIACISNKYFRMFYVVIAIAAQCFLAYEQIILCSPIFSWMADEDSQGYMKVTMDFMINFAWFLFNSAVKWELWFAPGRLEQILLLLSKLEGKLKRTGWQTFGIFQYPVVLGLFIYAHMTAFNIWEVQTALTNGNGTSVHDGVGSTYQTIRHTIVVAAAIYENQAMQLGTKLIPLISLVFLSLSLSFDRHDYNATEITEVLHLFNELSLCTKVCFGKTVVACCFCLLPYDAQNLQHFFESTWDLQCQYSYYILLLLFQLWAGAESHLLISNVNHMPLAVKGCTYVAVGPKTSLKQYKAMRSLWMDACGYSGLGIRGHCMTLTYSFLGNLAVWMLAYSITVTQFESVHIS